MHVHACIIIIVASRAAVRFDPNEARDIRLARLAGDAPTIAQDA
jgi:urease beta subunit